MTLLDFLDDPRKDELDRLACRAVFIMARAQIVSGASAYVDATAAWLLANLVLRMIDERVKHYPFLSARADAYSHGWPEVFDQSGSRRGEPLSPADIVRFCAPLLERANELLTRHEDSRLDLPEPRFKLACEEFGRLLGEPRRPACWAVPPVR
ncbi:MAG TPA: hypothetical protein V6D08_17100 [Candidatus Obscuribacterales bacterium]